MTSMRICGRGALAAALLAVGACATLRTGSDYDRSASFSAYHTFTWLQREHHGTTNPLVVQRAHDEIQAELARKGLVYVSDAATADLVIDFTIGSRERMDVRSYPAPYTGPWVWDTPGWWGYSYWGSELDVRSYREGTLSIDAFDAHTRRPVWHGWATKELSRADIEHSEGPVRAAVDAVLAGFPPR
jgi:hypothetical protein